jgi:HEPN domain-containing protein
MVLDPSFDFIRSVAILLDKHFLGARFPSALPGGVPAETHEAIDSERALEVANDVQAFVKERFAQCDSPSEG